MSDSNSDWRIGSELSEDDVHLLQAWRESQALLDARYNDKALLEVVARAIADENFRMRLLDDTPAALANLEQRLPAGTEFRFLANTESTVNVVLPPSAGQVRNGSGRLREALSSRTSAQNRVLSRDDIDLEDTEDDEPIPDKPIPEPTGDDSGKDDT